VIDVQNLLNNVDRSAARDNELPRSPYDLEVSAGVLSDRLDVMPILS
jgi:hypothetical protein